MGTRSATQTIRIDGYNRRPRRAYELQHREAALLELLQNHPSVVIRGLAARPEASWHLGRLYLIGVLTWQQYDAAVYLDKVTRRYEKLLRYYGHIHAGRLELTSSSTSEDLSLSAQKKCAHAQKTYDRVYSLLDQCGSDVRASIAAAMREDDAKANLDLIIRGLTVISVGLLGGGRRKR